MTIKILKNKIVSIIDLGIIFLAILMWAYFLFNFIKERNQLPDISLILAFCIVAIIFIVGFIAGLRRLILKLPQYIFYDDRYKVAQQNNSFEVNYEAIKEVIYNRRTKFIKFKIDKYKKKGNFKYWFLMGDTLQFSLNEASTEQIDEIMGNFTLLKKEVILTDKYILWHRVFAYLL